jgi:hypothetical protein
MTGIDIMLAAKTGAAAESESVETATSAAATNDFMLWTPHLVTRSCATLDRQGLAAGSRSSYAAGQQKVFGS